MQVAQNGLEWRATGGVYVNHIKKNCVVEDIHSHKWFENTIIKTKFQTASVCFKNMCSQTLATKLSRYLCHGLRTSFVSKLKQ